VFFLPANHIYFRYFAEHFVWVNATDREWGQSQYDYFAKAKRCSRKLDKRCISRYLTYINGIGSLEERLLNVNPSPSTLPLHLL
jgi:hypothetical protein